ncbi:MAG: c-type cytochrome [Planctomycetes bacterium]|nr:c-type cytochrome [Planctomycetota bacterium]
MKRISISAVVLIAVNSMAIAQPAKDPKAVAPKLSPVESAKTFKTADDLRFDQVLAEPTVKQPLSLSFDERGRLWVVQYLQYPHPAGLKIMSRDIHWRIVYDKVPPPPTLRSLADPKNEFRGKDIISIHEDTKGTGVYDKHSVFLEGGNIITSVVRGRGGLWALNPPYLLFYPMKDGVDAPSGDPVVHLQGFGLEDTHSCANSLRWGPDGWLYATHGSTVSAHITRPGVKEPAIQMIGQHMWRYHPDKKRFEIFAEGGGNAFGVEFDSVGRVYSGHNGGDTRGFHYVQGASYRKGFEKHGVLANPFSFGFFEAMKANKSQRFSHTWVLNEADGLPSKYHGNMFAVEPIHSRVMRSDVSPDRSSFETKDLGGIVTTTDTWFRPVDIKAGPDGSLYVADLHEAKIAHGGHNEGVIDRETGRVYRLAAKDAKFTKPADLSKKTSAELVELLKSRNRWERQTANRLLGDRKDRAVLPALRDMLLREEGQAALEALWAINLISGLDEALVKEILPRHQNGHVRAWTVRLLADDRKLGEKLAPIVANLAMFDPSPYARSQYAASAKRLPAKEGLPIVEWLLLGHHDENDIHIPLLLWWAIEVHCAKDRDQVLDMWRRESSLWDSKTAQQTILPRLMKRFAMAGSQADFESCTRLFQIAPEKRHRLILLKAFEEAFKGRSVTGLPEHLVSEITKLGGGSVAFGVRQGNKEAVDQALESLKNPKTPAAERIELIDIFGESKQPRCIDPLVKLLESKESPALHKAVLGALQSYKEVRIGAAVVEQYPTMTEEVREVAESLLVSRREWSRELVIAVDLGKIPAKSISLATLRKLLLHRDAEIPKLVKKHWGEVKGATTEQMRKEVDRLATVVSTGKGDPYPGKKFFTAKCANCHTFHGVGGIVGPDLTPFKRDDVPNLLLHIINPSAEIREGYENSVIVTESGRTLTGIVVEKDARVVVLRTADGQRLVLPKDDIDTINVVGISLMPEGLLDGLSDQAVRDLFAYLRSGQPLNERK